MAGSAAQQEPTPISPWRAALYFGGPGALVHVGIYTALPQLHERGVPLILTWTFFAVAPHLLLATAVLILYFRRTGAGWEAFAKRFRLKPIERRHWPWIIAALPVILAMNFSLSWTIPLLADTSLFAPPAVVPELFQDPYEATSSASPFASFMGVSTRGNWWLVLYWLGWLAIATVGEEILWRGYLLPRQERVHGRWAWLVNGLLWNLLFHAAFWSNSIADMPMMLIIPWLTQKTRSTWTAILLHGAMISLAFPQLLLGVIGVDL